MCKCESLKNQMCVFPLLTHKKSLHLEGTWVSQVYEGSWTQFCCVCVVVEGGSFPSIPPSNPQIPAGYLRIKLRSDTVYLEMASDSIG